MAASTNPRARLEHILFHIRGVSETIAGANFKTFSSTYHMERTVERAVQVISEAVRALPAALTARYPEIEWSKIAAIGNVLRHEYERIDSAIMWDIATARLSEMEPIVRRMLAEPDQ
jgi:uncharacterized protein with HEPN domain